MYVEGEALSLRPKHPGAGSSTSLVNFLRIEFYRRPAGSRMGQVFIVVPNTKAITAHTSRSPWLLFVVFVVLPLFLLLAIASEVPRAGGRSRNRFNNVKTSAQQDQTMRSKEERRTLFSRNTIMTSRRRSRSEEEGGRQECSFFSSWLVV